MALASHRPDTSADYRDERVEHKQPVLSYSFRWAVLAMLALIILGSVAPSGLLLLAFLGVIILVHEGGHFLVAKASGMAPTEFFWGFGPEIVAWQRGDLRVGLKVVFLGGYVKIPGMTPSEVVREGFDESKTYRAAAPLGRLLTILAGPATNFVFALLAFYVVALRGGVGVVESLSVAGGYVWVVISGTAEALAIWVTSIGGYVQATITGGQPPVRFLSPVSQAQVTGEAVADGLDTSLLWFGILSCAIGGVNLLPLPPLDGGHAMVVVGEWIAQRVRRNRSIRIDAARLTPLAYVTLVAIALLSVSALIMDLRGVPLQ